MAPSDVRIRLLGIANVTKRGYLLYKEVCIVITAVLFVIFVVWQPGPPLSRNFVIANLEWVMLLLIAIQIFETYLGLGRFREQERLRARRTSL